MERERLSISGRKESGNRKRGVNERVGEFANLCKEYTEDGVKSIHYFRMSGIDSS